MDRTIKRIISLILFAWVTLCMPFAAMAAESNQTAKYLIRNIPNPTCNSIGGEWAIVGLSRCSYPVPEEYFEKYYKNLERVVKECNGILSEDSYTEYSRVIIALSSIEKDGKNVAGYDLSKPLKNYKKVIEQGLNGAIYALLALDAGGYSGPQIQLRDYIIQKELTSGGWSFWEKGSADPDMTAMAVQALSRYRYDKKTKSAIDRAMPILKMKSFESCETVSQVILALDSIGIKPDESLKKQLMQFRCSNGGFKHSLEDEEANLMSTEQALMAISVLEKWYVGVRP